MPPAAGQATPSATVIDYATLAAPELGRAFDAAVDASVDIDRFCSQHAFVTAAFEGLQPGRDARVFRVGDGWLAFAERRASMLGDPRPRKLWEPLEAMWGLACPIVGAAEAELSLALAGLAHEAAAEGDAPVILACGLVARSVRTQALVAALSPVHRLVQGAETVRVVASLEDGVDGFLRRRSPGFRGKLRRARRAATTKGLRYERHDPATPEEALRLYARAAVLDDVSWKGRSEAGLRASGLYAFYERMLPRLVRDRSLRMGFLVDGDTDVAYLFGGLRHGTFRGLQFAFRAGREAESLGNVVQLLEVERLCEEGALRYDLGTEADYKHHFGELVDRTTSLIAIPKRR